MNKLLERLEGREVFVDMLADDLVIAAANADEIQRAIAVLEIWCKDIR